MNVYSPHKIKFRLLPLKVTNEIILQIPCLNRTLMINKILLIEIFQWSQVMK